ncbi:Ribonuclease H1 [Sarracenia purpurea var. burkii]
MSRLKSVKVGDESKEFLLDEEGSTLIYTDGVCLRNNQVNSLGAIAVWFGENHFLNFSKIYEREFCTNNESELLAIQMAMKPNAIFPFVGTPNMTLVLLQQDKLKELENAILLCNLEPKTINVHKIRWFRNFRELSPSSNAGINYNNSALESKSVKNPYDTFICQSETDKGLFYSNPVRVVPITVSILTYAPTRKI